jgi:hypothetical protein
VEGEKVLTTLGNRELDSVLEVALCTDATGGPHVELRRLSWGEGVGWYRQQTLQITVAEAEGLLLALRASRSKWKSRAADSSRKVIPFPTLTSSPEKPERRTAWQQDTEKRAGGPGNEPSAGVARATRRGKG